jgi:hypothetical protein
MLHDNIYSIPNMKYISLYTFKLIWININRKKRELLSSLHGLYLCYYMKCCYVLHSFLYIIDLSLDWLINVETDSYLFRHFSWYELTSTEKREALSCVYDLYLYYYIEYCYVLQSLLYIIDSLVI